MCRYLAGARWGWRSTLSSIKRRPASPAKGVSFGRADFYFGRVSMTRFALPIERSMLPTPLMSTRVEMPT